jgi:hypothetical protein
MTQVPHDPAAAPPQSVPSLSEAKAAARQLGGASASVVCRFLDALVLQPASPAPAPPDLPAQPLQRPPLGLRPLEFAVRDRRTELLAAIERYSQAGTEVPEAWKRELAEVHWALELLRNARQSRVFF